MKIIEGDLIKLALDGKFDLIVHGCNCFCTMGAGIAKTIKEYFPEAYEADLQTEKGSREKIGSISSVTVTRGINNITVVNGYTQYSPSGPGILVDYEAVISVFREIKQKFSGYRIGYPMIGAGLAKGDWQIISELILEQLTGENHTLVKYKE
jgi:O-acetyl-ADP-ribose deacetylase (regulator of RNase III)